MWWWLFWLAVVFFVLWLHVWSGFTDDLLCGIIRTDKFGTMQRSKATAGPSAVLYLHRVIVCHPKV